MELKSRFKLSLVFLLATTPVAALALQPIAQIPVANPLCTFCGFTVGLGLGATTFMTRNSADVSSSSDPFFLPFIIDRNITLAAPTPGNSASGSTSKNLYRYSAMGAVYAGFGSVLDNYMYWGAELGANFFGANDTSLNVNAQNNVEVTYTDTQDGRFSRARVNHTFDLDTKVTRNSVEPFLDLKLGWLMTPTALAYVKGGINYNKIELKTTGNITAEGRATGAFDSVFPLHASTSTGFETKHSQSNVGYRAGIGTEILITPELGVGAEYVYTWYRKLNTNVSGTGSDVVCDAIEGCVIVPASVNASSSVTPNDQQVMAQLVYHLGNFLG